MTIQSVLDFAGQRREQNLDYLIEYLRIPSIGTLSRHQSDMVRTTDWLISRMQAIGLKQTLLVPTGGQPAVYAERLDAGPEAPTLLVYGHYDVQPTDPEEEWLSPPFEPAIRDGNLFARGASDNKGQHYAHLAAAEAFLQSQGALPVNLKFFIEGEEESGSPNLETAVKEQSGLLACDAVVISDSSFLDAQTPVITTGVRGLTYLEVEVSGPKQDLHSGGYGGVAHNPLQVVAEMLAALHDERGRVAIPGFYDRVRPLSNAEREAFQRIPFDEEKFLRDEVGAPALWSGEEGYSPLERIGARPTLEIHGIRGGFTSPGQKTVIPARASVKISMRLVPDQDPREIAHLFERHIQAIAPDTVKVVVHPLSYADAALVETDSPAVQEAVVAYRQGFGLEPVFLRGGGTLPVVAEFAKVLKVPVVMMGYGLPDDNLHAPNEKFNLEHFYRGINTSIHYIQAMANW